MWWPGLTKDVQRSPKVRESVGEADDCFIRINELAASTQHMQKENKLRICFVAQLVYNNCQPCWPVLQVPTTGRIWLAFRYTFAFWQETLHTLARVATEFARTKVGKFLQNIVADVEQWTYPHFHCATKAAAGALQTKRSKIIKTTISIVFYAIFERQKHTVIHYWNIQHQYRTIWKQEYEW